GKLLDLGKQEEVPVRFLIEEMLDLVDDVVDKLGTRDEIEYIRTILQNGTSADRQLRKFHETQSLEAVIDMLAEETAEGC
ncbi:MAG: carboxylate-amine ligase, partial [bacterium]